MSGKRPRRHLGAGQCRGLIRYVQLGYEGLIGVKPITDRPDQPHEVHRRRCRCARKRLAWLAGLSRARISDIYGPCSSVADAGVPLAQPAPMGLVRYGAVRSDARHSSSRSKGCETREGKGSGGSKRYPRRSRARIMRMHDDASGALRCVTTSTSTRQRVHPIQPPAFRPFNPSIPTNPSNSPNPFRTIPPIHTTP